MPQAIINTFERKAYSPFLIEHLTKLTAAAVRFEKVGQQASLALLLRRDHLWELRRLEQIAGADL